MIDLFAYNRLNQLFILLYEKDILSAKEISQKLSVSDRTIRSDIQQLNELLLPYQAKIHLTRGKGYQIHHKENLVNLYNEASTNNQDHYALLETTEDRLRQLLLIFFNTSHYLSLDVLCKKIFVGRTTLLGYIKQLRSILIAYDLKIEAKTNHGYKISGNEVNIRQCLSEQLIERNFNSYISEFSIFEKQVFSNIDLEGIRAYLAVIFPPRKFKISDYNRKNFIIQIAIAIQRNQISKKINQANGFVFLDIDINHALTELFEWIEEHYLIVLDQNEQKWLNNHLAAEFQLSSTSQKQRDHVDSLVQELLTDIKMSFNQNLMDDSTLRSDLIAHFNNYLPLRKLLKFKENPLLDTIKKNFPYAFDICFITISKNIHFDKYAFTEEDIGFIALHIAAALERKQDFHNKKKVIIVCGQGVSTSRLIEAIIKKKFIEEIEVVDILSFASYQLKDISQVDFIISTIPLKEERIPVIQIDFLSINESLLEIERSLVKQSPPVNAKYIFRPDLFHLSNKNSDKDIIIEGCQKLEEKQIVNKRFIEKILGRERIAPTNLTNWIAIPHAIDPTIEHTEIFISICRNPINWFGNGSVKIIFLLAVAEKEKEALQDFFEQLSDIVDNDTIQKKMASSKTFDDFIENFQF